MAKIDIFRGWRNVTGQNPLPPNIQRMFLGKKAICESSLNKKRMYVWNRHIKILPQTWKFPFLFYIILTSHLYQIWHLYLDLYDCNKRLVLPILLCLSDASLTIADNCNALCRSDSSACCKSVSAWFISYVNYGDTCCKVSNLSLFVTQ